MFNKSRVFAVFTCLALIFSIWLTYAQNVNDDIAGSVLRLHIIANSDTTPDQMLKIKVRDRVLSDCGHLFKNAETPAESAEIARENIEFIHDVAANEVYRNGRDYPLKVTVEDSAFPTKTYGGISLPAGKYTALKIIIGDGIGQNWWCVMYPPLCFVDGVTVVPESSQEQLKSTLSDDEYELITETNKSKVKVKFKIAETVGKYLP